MGNKRTFTTSLDGPINALAVNRDANQVAVAGRNVFKILEIDDNQNVFRETINLRVGKNLNLNYSCNDVGWSFIETNLLATAATNGAIVIWNLMKSSRSKVDQVFAHHKRTVNKVCFHPSECSYLLSGSQDGTMKLFDLRKRDIAVDFNSQSESVRDVQFSPGTETLFAAVQENGNVQLWDYRKSDRYVKQFTAHSGPVFSCDWHPEEKRFLATAGRDKTIKVWDVNFDVPTVKYTIHTIASVAKLRWRPFRKYNIASCSLVVDFSIYVWDYNRPYVPFAAFMDHRDVTTGFSWRNDAKTIISAGKDGILCQHVIKDAYRPASHANPAGLTLNCNGDIVHAHSDYSSSRLAAYRASSSQAAPATTSAQSQFFQLNVPTGQQGGNALRLFNQKAELLELFRCCHSELMYSFEPSPTIGTLDWFFVSAIRYRLSGSTIPELCSQNADVAMHLNRQHVAQVWRVIGQFYSNCSGRSGTFSGPASAMPIPISSSSVAAAAVVAEDKSLDSNADTIHAPSRHTSGNIGSSVFKATPLILQELTSAQTEEDSDSSVVNDVSYFTPSNGKGYQRITERSVLTSGDVSGSRSHRQQQTPATPQATVSDYFFGDADISSSKLTTPFDLGASSSNAYDLAQDYELQREAFQPRHPIQEVQSPLDIDDGSSPTSLDEEEIFEENVNSNNNNYNNNNSVNQHNNNNNTVNSNYSNLNINNFNLNDNFSRSILSITAPVHPQWMFLDIIKEILFYYVKLGDVQMAVSIASVLGDRIRNLVDEHLLEIWSLSYIDLLNRFQLYNVINRVITLSPLRSVNLLNHTSTTIYTSCNKCSKPLAGKVSWLCDRCKISPSKCAVCHDICRGLYAWCQGCSHGGHVKHMQDWFATNRQCPAGCGHQCEYT